MKPLLVCMLVACATPGEATSSQAVTCNNCDLGGGGSITDGDLSQILTWTMPVRTSTSDSSVQTPLQGVLGYTGETLSDPDARASCEVLHYDVPVLSCCLYIQSTNTAACCTYDAINWLKCGLTQGRPAWWP